MRSGGSATAGLDARARPGGRRDRRGLRDRVPRGRRRRARGSDRRAQRRPVPGRRGRHPRRGRRWDGRRGGRGGLGGAHRDVRRREGRRRPDAGRRTSRRLRVVDIGFPDDLVPSDARHGRARRRRRASCPVARATRTRGRAARSSWWRDRASMTGAVRLDRARRPERLGAGLRDRGGAGLGPAGRPGRVDRDRLRPAARDRRRHRSAAALEPVLERAADADALAIGPGSPRDAETARFVRDLVGDAPVPLVLDADGLNAFAGEADAITERKADAVLTPHSGELAPARPAGGRELDGRARPRRPGRPRRRGAGEGDPQRDRRHPGARRRVNPTGSPYLATAGTGDVLTGRDRRPCWHGGSTRSPPRGPARTCTGSPACSPAGTWARGRWRATSPSTCPRRWTPCGSRLGRDPPPVPTHVGRGRSGRDPAQRRGC